MQLHLNVAITRLQGQEPPPAPAPGVITWGTGPSRGCTWECVPATRRRMPPSLPWPFRARTLPRAQCGPGKFHRIPVQSRWKRGGWGGGGGCYRPAGWGENSTRSVDQQCLQTQRQCAHILNCGLFRVNKESTQQRMLLSSLRRLMPPTAWKPALQPTPARRPVWSSVGENIRVMDRMEMGSQLSG